MNFDQNLLGVRVFKRSAKYLVLLWRKQPEADPLQTEITFKNVRANEPSVRLKPEHFQIDEAVGRKSIEDQAGEPVSQTARSPVNRRQLPILEPHCTPLLSCAMYYYHNSL